MGDYIDQRFDLLPKSNKNHIGQRIRKIREAAIPQMSQGELGEMIGLNANRVQQYENGARTPRQDILQDFAKALKVDPAFLQDPDTTSYIGIMYALFQIEQEYGIEITENNGKFCLNINDEDPILYSCMATWYQRQLWLDVNLKLANTEEQRKNLKHAYLMWEWNFPSSTVGGRDFEKFQLRKAIQDLDEQEEITKTKLKDLQDTRSKFRQYLINLDNESEQN